ncbi:MAG TPA: DNA recombination protein RmuC [Burkholderiaceae bacterium]|nr:DNA recombination protein RmuC [Burkholderiaceae bacterium]
MMGGLQLLAPDWTAVALLLGAAALGALVCGLWMRSGLRRVRTAWHDTDRELGRAQALAEQLRERLDEALDGLHGREAELRELSTQLRELQVRHVRLQTLHNERQEHFQEMQAALEQARHQMKLEFQTLAGRILDEQGRTFSANSQTALDAMLRPFREQIDAFQKRVNQIHDEAVRGTASLGTEIRRVADMSTRISAEAGDLAAALRGDNKVLGNWGEVQLERTLELAGLVRGDHYVAQPPYRDDQDRRRHPDFVVHLPDDKHMVLDSKVSLLDYERAVTADTDDERDRAMQAHVRAVRRHVDDLAGKDYGNLAGISAPGFVLMYMPVEAAYIEALRHSPDLYEYAWRKNVVLVSHTTLLPVLKTVANVWMMVRSNEQAHELGERAADVYNQVALMAERLKRLGATLGTASGHYNDVVTAVAGQQGLYGKVARFAELSSRANKVLPALSPRDADFHVERLVQTPPADGDAE